MDIQNLRRVDAGNTFVLIVTIINKPSQLLFACPMSSKEALGMTPKLLDLMLTLGMPLSIRSDARGEFALHVVDHLRRLTVSIEFGPVDYYSCSQ